MLEWSFWPGLWGVYIDFDSQQTDARILYIARIHGMILKVVDADHAVYDQQRAVLTLTVIPRHVDVIFRVAIQI